MNVRRRASLEIQYVGEEVLVNDPDRAKVHVLNGTAGDVLELCDGTHSCADIARVLAAATGVDAAAIEPDIVAIVATFAEYGFFES